MERCPRASPELDFLGSGRALLCFQGTPDEVQTGIKVAI